jgi:hypothetical protein
VNSTSVPSGAVATISTSMSDFKSPQAGTAVRAATNTSADVTSRLFIIVLRLSLPACGRNTETIAVTS